MYHFENIFFTTIKRRCDCDRNLSRCMICYSNKICFHNIKIARCIQCPIKSGTSLCKLTDYQQGIFFEEKCLCGKCNKILKIKKCKLCKIHILEKEKLCSQCYQKSTTICSFCKKNVKYKNDRCVDCLKKFADAIRFEKELFNSQHSKNEARDYLQQMYSQSNTTSEDLIKKIQSDQKHRKKFVTRAMIQFENLFQIKSPFYFSEAANACIFSLCITNKNYVFEIQLRFSMNYSKDISKLFQLCNTDENLLILLKLIWFLINNNHVVMKELIRDSDLLNFIKNLESEVKQDSLQTVKEIIGHFENYGLK